MLCSDDDVDENIEDGDFDEDGVQMDEAADCDAHSIVAVANYKNDATYTIHFTLALISFVLLYFITY